MINMITNEKIESYATNKLDLTFTDSLDSSLYLLSNGKMISGADEYGERTEDHRCLLDLVLNDKNYYALKNQAQAWKDLHKQTGVARICPETKQALIAAGQKLTGRQKQILDNNQYNIETYC